MIIKSSIETYKECLHACMHGCSFKCLFPMLLITQHIVAYYSLYVARIVSSHVKRGSITMRSVSSLTGVSTPNNHATWTGLHSTCLASPLAPWSPSNLQKICWTGTIPSHSLRYHHLATPVDCHFYFPHGHRPSWVLALPTASNIHGKQCIIVWYVEESINPDINPKGLSWSLRRERPFWEDDSR